MPTLDAAATLEQANDFKADYDGGTLVVKDGATTLATHTVTSFTTSNSGSNGVATAGAGAIADATITATGTADTVEFSNGGKVITLAIGSDVTLSTTNYISGETSSVSSLVFTFPAS